MAGAARPGGISVTRELALQRAAEWDRKRQQEISQRVLGGPVEVFGQIQAYLWKRADELKTSNNPKQLLKQTESRGVVAITLGPTIDKGWTAEHFRFDSGARLSFGLTLRVLDRHRSELVSFRYHYQLPESRSPGYLRFDLNKAVCADALIEPVCHFHPGREHLRIPLSLHHPLEILDRIFFVLEPGSSADAT
jgi:hypothetical protein